MNKQLLKIGLEIALKMNPNATMKVSDIIKELDNLEPTISEVREYYKTKCTGYCNATSDESYIDECDTEEITEEIEQCPKNWDIEEITKMINGDKHE